MKVYHGSLNRVKKPNVDRGRPNTDFGKGFYATTNFEQAKRWAINKQKTIGKEAKAIVNTYEVDDNLLNDERYNIKKFDSPNGEWLSFVISCRRFVPHQYDLVFGAVANDKIYATITLYESQILTAEETVARLKVNEYYNQISFHTNEAINELKFIGSEEVVESFNL
jgi:hypothetical protein